MAVYHNYVGILTRSNIHLMKRDSLQYSKVFSLWHGYPLGYGALAFVDKCDKRDTSNHETTIRVVVSNSDWMRMVTIPVDTPVQNIRQNYPSWWFRPGAEFDDSQECILQPLLGRASEHVSWLQGPSKIQPSLAPMRFVATTQGLSSGLSSQWCGSLSNYPCCILSESDMPALYAASVRDYDEELGLLIIGNMMGELVLYSLSGSTLDNIEGCLRPFLLREHGGKEMLSTVSNNLSPTCCFTDTQCLHYAVRFL
jgi:hypothetical protein